MTFAQRFTALGFALAALAAGARAQQAGSPGSAETEQHAAWEAAAKLAQKGPADIALGSQAKLALPSGFVYLPAEPAARVLKAMGNTVGASFQGMIVPRSDDDSMSFYVLNYEPAGYVKDDDARNWKADELLERVRAGTEEANQKRREMGLPELEVSGWIEQPHYAEATHQLVWSIAAHTKGAPADQGDVLNVRTLVLGREGYLAMTLVTDQQHVEALRSPTANLLDHLQFEQGQRYADFNATTDHVAEFGLAALVAGVAAKKLGLIALAAAFAIKFAKLIALAVAGVALALRKRLGWKKKDALPAALPPVQAAVAAPPAAPAVAPPAETPPAAGAPPGAGS
jgi:uncharacterized membrane-anchored protein